MDGSRNFLVTLWFLAKLLQLGYPPKLHGVVRGGLSLLKDVQISISLFLGTMSWYF